MTRTYLAKTLVTAASLVVFAGCGKQNQSTDNPDEYDGYTALHHATTRHYTTTPTEY